MQYLVDTNILLRFADSSHPLHSTIRSTMRRLREEDHQLCIAPQNCVEFWNVVTRPRDRNGFGLPPDGADRLLNLVECLFFLLPDSPRIYPEWRRLVVDFGVSGVQVHDARLVAIMKVHQISHILTLNSRDFERYGREGVVIVNPGSS